MFVNRLVLAVAAAAAAVGVAIPAVAGLSGNPSFSERIPVRPPTSAHIVEYNPNGSVHQDDRDPSAVRYTPTSTKSDDHGAEAAVSTSTEIQEARDATNASRSAGDGQQRADRRGRATGSPHRAGEPTHDAREPRPTPTPQPSEDNGGRVGDASHTKGRGPSGGVSAPHAVTATRSDGGGGSSGR